MPFMSLATGSADETVKICDLANRKTITLKELPYISTLCYSSDGSTLITANGGNVQTWAVATGQPKGSFKSGVSARCFSSARFTTKRSS